MSSVVERALETLSANPVGSSDWMKAAVYAADVIERALTTEVYGDQGWPAEVAAADLSRADIAPLASALAELVEKNIAKASISSAVWALGKTFDGRFVPVYRAVLAAHVDGGSGAVVHQALIAMNNLGYLAEYSSWSLLEEDENRRRARELLATL